MTQNYPSLPLVLGSTLVLLGAGLAAALLSRSRRAALAVGTGGALLAGLVGLAGSVPALFAPPTSLEAGWAVPMGALHVGLDPLSAFFLVVVFLVSSLAALYGAGYLAHAAEDRPLGPVLFFFELLVAAMAVLVVARDAVLFLVAWETMFVASFFLVTFEHDREEVRRAGLVYLVASHLGLVFLLLLFGLLRAHAGSWDFDLLAAHPLGGGAASAAFALALVGFGTKAGFWPLHVWLPDAHPAAPSHVSAVMSGVMIEMGVYGLVRVLPFLGPPPAAWGAALIAVGAVTAVLGILHALAQRDLKRMLAYSSVENVGIVALGLGVGLLGRAAGRDTVALLGFAGALLHVLGHGVFKGLLFQGAGAVLHATGTRVLDDLGGLARKMPRTALAFAVGSAAIAGLPPLGGFVGELLVFLGALRGAAELPAPWAAASVTVIPALALTGGLASAAFVRAFGVAFLGEARSPAAASAHDPGRLMLWPMAAGVVLSAAVGLFPREAARLVAGAAGDLAAASAGPALLEPLGGLALAARLLAALLVLAALARLALLRGREVAAAPTWGCGYERPSPRMQYTAASFSGPVLEPFAALLPRHARGEGPDGFFPERARREAHLGDLAGERFLLPAVQRATRLLGRLRPIQSGRIQRYVVYILATLVALLVWQLSALPR